MTETGYIDNDDTFDVHDGGQLRIGVEGDQRPLLALPADEIPQGHVDPPALPGDDGFRWPWEAHRRHPHVPGQMEVESD